MAKDNNIQDFLTDVADAIRDKKGTSDLINPQDFSNEIASIEVGGGGGIHIGSTEPSDDDSIWIDITEETPPSIIEISRDIRDEAIPMINENSINYINEQNYQNEEDVKALVDEQIIKSVVLNVASYTIQPNIFYIFPTANVIEVGLEPITDTSRYNEYMFQFISNDSTKLSLPANIKWIGNNEVEPNMTYQVSIVNNIAVMGGASNE
jgi:hypothetical protein